MKKILLIILILLALLEYLIPIVSAQNTKIVTIKYCLEPFRTFEIVGTDMKKLKLENLSTELKKIKSINPEAKYEILAEVKSTPETIEKIKKAIENAGIQLEHYWVPTSFGIDNPGGPAEGILDILNKNKSL
ncbi:MAG: hypothetical protein KJ915_00050 [Candidatus Omnitrophica bacterium]|nr:hypothetical protein [Candidatus Omnitrophota bacterium]